MKILPCLLVALAAGCATPQSGSHIQVTEWGVARGEKASLFTLTNRGGMTAKITNYGTTLTELHVPGRDGKTADVVLGFDNLDDYVRRNPFFGCIAGRYANRIAKGRFVIDGKTHQVTTNNGPNHIHGGKRGFDKYVWKAEAVETDEGPSVRMTHVSPDGDEGFPGTLTVTCTTTLTHANELRIEFTATTDKPTIVNLANHTYWNLAGHDSGDVLGQELRLFAEKYTPADARLIPTGEMAPVAGTPFDFRKPKPIGKDIAVLTATRGYDNNFVVDGTPGELRPVAVARDPKSGRVMELFATAPGVQLFTANGLKRKGKGGADYQPRHGFCLETQAHPDTPNKPDWPSCVLRPGETYRHVMVHRFSVK